MTLVVLLGGASAGKSSLALDLAARRRGPVAYIATAQARDHEMAARIARHQRDRPESWWTVEEPVEIGRALAGLEEEHTAIVDCLTLWVANLLERGDLRDAIVAEADAVARTAASRGAPVIVVSNEVGFGIVPANELARSYRDVLGEVNRTFVRHSEKAGLVVAGRVLTLDAASTW